MTIKVRFYLKTPHGGSGSGYFVTGEYELDDIEFNRFMQDLKTSLVQPSKMVFGTYKTGTGPIVVCFNDIAFVG